MPTLTQTAHLHVKRTDIPAKVLQLNDLFPHTSLSNTVNLPPGQTRYLKRASSVWNTVATTGTNPIITAAEYQGLAAYLIDNLVSGGGTSPVQATATITVTAVPVVGTITIGGVVLTAAAGARTPGNDDFDGTLGTTDLVAAEIVAAINDVANGFDAIVTAAAVGSIVTITAVPIGVLGNAITLTETSGQITISGALLTGGVSTGTGALTAANANAASAALLAIADAGTALTLSAVNAAIAGVVAGTSLTGGGSTGSLLTLLQVIGGRIYTVPSQSIIEAASAKSTAKGSLDTSYYKHTVRGGVFEASLLYGQVSKLKLSTFRYKNTNGAALVVYDDDGNVI
jgi:hypothetical protein